jgi:hypothetical protein
MMNQFFGSEIKYWLREIRIEKIQLLLNQKLKANQLKNKETNE